MDLPGAQHRIGIFDFIYGQHFLPSNFTGYGNLPVPSVYSRIQVTRVQYDKPSLTPMRFLGPSPSVEILLQYYNLCLLLEVLGFDNHPAP